MLLDIECLTRQPQETLCFGYGMNDKKRGVDMDRNTTVNLGEQRFDRIREENRFYIDKTDFIREWWESGSTVTLLTRPRRFGKTLNMSMLECFFSNKYAGRGDLFEGLGIWNAKSPDGEYRYRQLQGTYPVIFMSFASVKTGNMEEIKTRVKQIITDVYGMYRNIIRSELFSQEERKYFESVNDNMNDSTAVVAINRLCGYLEKCHGRKVIVLLDEYDTPMQESWLQGNWDETVDFFRNFFNSTFKTNPHLYRGVITGITRVSRESIFSDLNNLEVVTTTSDNYAASFGFTQDEVFKALDDMGLGDEKEGVKQWYDGFTFGKYTDIYNPWSIASFIRNKGKYAAYWSNTSSNGLINSLIRRGNAEVKQIMEELLEGKSFEAAIDEQVVFSQLNGNADAVWSLLLATGYLRILGTRGADDDEEDDVYYTLALTNHEVRKMFTKMVKGWFEGDNTKVYYNEFIRAMLCDDVRRMNTFMNKVALHTFSSFDSGNHPSDETQPERFYHGFVLGMVVNLADKYKIRSNRESGYGRYDVMIEPKDKKEKAFIFEFKVMDADDDEKTLEDTVANAHKQIEEKQYETELVSDGYAPGQIRKYGFAFRGRECLIG